MENDNEINEIIAANKAHKALLDWLEIRTKTRIGHDELIVQLLKVLEIACPRRK